MQLQDIVQDRLLLFPQFRCLFWAVEGSDISDAVLILGDSATRAWSVWGEAVQPGSPADRTVERLRDTPEGKAVIGFVGC